MSTPMSEEELKEWEAKVGEEIAEFLRKRKEREAQEEGLDKKSF